jgi:hypothetical protein
MVELSVLLGLVVLLAVALGPAHRHSALPFRPGEDTSVDRDRARVVADLRAVHPATTGCPGARRTSGRLLRSLGRRAAHRLLDAARLRTTRAATEPTRRQ